MPPGVLFPRSSITRRRSPVAIEHNSENGVIDREVRDRPGLFRQVHACRRLNVAILNVCVRACGRTVCVQLTFQNGSHKKHGTLKCNDYFVILLDGVDATVTLVTRHSLAIINHYER